MPKKDYYEILGIARDASAEEIKKAYWNLAKKHHPDASSAPNASEKFKEINEAYQILSDPQKRSQYDRFGTTSGSSFEGFSGFGMDDLFGSDSFENIFDMFFGGGNTRGRRRARDNKRPGDSLQYEISISFREAALGTEKEITYTKYEICPSCHGTGARPGSSSRTCPTCHGSGRVKQVQRTILGEFSTVHVCPTCHGEGKIIDEPCDKCRGTGRVRVSKKLKITIPPGIENGTRLRFRGGGDIGEKGGEAGDLYILVNVEEDSIFKRKNFDIIINAKIGIVTASLGGTIEVPTLTGKEILNISPGTQNGAIFRLHGKGIRASGHRIGDEVIVINVGIPKRLSKKAKEILEELGEELGEKRVVEKNSKTIINKVKNVFRGGVK